MSRLNLEDYRYVGKGRCRLADHPTKLKKRLYKDDASLTKALQAQSEEIDALQQKMMAHDRYAMLLIFQAMDAAGKDGTIKHVMKGINPHGVEVHAFKRPSEDELDHDYLWRTQKVVPPRGRIGLFNRSYYEEVLVVKVHPEIVTSYQRLPEECTKDLKALWPRRYEEIRNFENMLHANGTRVVKFFLHVSKEEQKARFLERIATPSKNWKFNAGDVAERAHWEDYQKAYRDAMESTASKSCPWYIVPADDKGDMRLIVSAAILHELQKLELSWPELSPEQRAALAKSKKDLLAE